MRYLAALLASLLVSCGAQLGVGADPDITAFCEDVIDLVVDCFGYPRVVVKNTLDCGAYNRETLCTSLYEKRSLLALAGIEIEGTQYDEHSMTSCMAGVEQRSCEELREGVPVSCSDVCRR